MQRLCSIFFYEGYISIAPTVINLSKVLDECGYSVTIFATRNNQLPQPENIGNGVKIRYFTKIFKLHLFSKRPTLKRLLRIMEVIIFSFQSFANTSESKQESKKTKTQINIGIDLHGLVVALLCFYLLKQKFIFLSLELEEEVKNFKYMFNPLIKIANLAYKKAEAVIVQDEDRFKSLSDYYQFQHPQVFYLPNSPFNDLSSDANIGQFFRDKFNLSKEEFPYIVLSAGHVGDLVYSKSLAQAFVSIDRCALIFHVVNVSRGIKEEEFYIQALRQLNSKTLFLSLNLLPYDQVDKIFTSATIGIAFYADDNDNYGKIAKASGKLGQYLKHGKPVLVNNLPALCQLIEKYQCGIVINEPSDAQEIKLAIDKIINFYDAYSKNAKLCFEAEFDFGKKVEPILSFMDSLQTAAKGGAEER